MLEGQTLLQNTTDTTYTPIYSVYSEPIVMDYDKQSVKEVCFQESNTIVCGKITFYDYDKIEKELTVEPFYGDCDLFGF